MQVKKESDDVHKGGNAKDSANHKNIGETARKRFPIIVKTGHLVGVGSSRLLRVKLRAGPNLNRKPSVRRLLRNRLDGNLGAGWIPYKRPPIGGMSRPFRMQFHECSDRRWSNLLPPDFEAQSDQSLKCCSIVGTK